MVLGLPQKVSKLFKILITFKFHQSKLIWTSFGGVTKIMMPKNEKN